MRSLAMLIAQLAFEWRKLRYHSTLHSLVAMFRCGWTPAIYEIQLLALPVHVFRKHCGWDWIIALGQRHPLKKISTAHARIDLRSPARLIEALRTRLKRRQGKFGNILAWTVCWSDDSPLSELEDSARRAFMSSDRQQAYCQFADHIIQAGKRMKINHRWNPISRHHLVWSLPCASSSSDAFQPRNTPALQPTSKTIQATQYKI